MVDATTSPIEAGGPRLRADAAHNRRRILRAAHEVFADAGLDAPVAQVARRAGVSTATLYRRFPTREALVVAVFDDQVAACVQAVVTAAEDPDPWRGFCAVVQTLCTMGASERGLTAAFLAHLGSRVDVGEQRSRAEQAFVDLVVRAKTDGRLRADFHRRDLSMVLLAARGLAQERPEMALAASARLAAYLLQAFAADHARPLPPLPGQHRGRSPGAAAEQGRESRPAHGRPGPAPQEP